MKKILFLVIAIFAIQIVLAQETTSGSADNVYNTTTVDVKPQFSGGYEAFYEFIRKNYKMPKVEKLEGKVYVTFVIEKDGNLDEIRVLRDIGYGTGQEAIRVLELSPKWNPAEKNGQKVRCQFSIPITLQSS